MEVWRDALQRLARGFPDAPVARGEKLRDAGRILDLDFLPHPNGDGWVGRALVQGTSVYRTVVAVRGKQVQIFCTCPYAEERASPCKHIWGVIIEGLASRAFEIPPEPVNVLFEPQLRSGAFASGSGSSRDDWRRLVELTEFRMGTWPRRESGTARTLVELRYRVVLADELRRAHSIELHLEHRKRRKDGSWGPFRRRKFDGRAVDCRHPEDSRILEILEQLALAADPYPWDPHAVRARYEVLPAMFGLLVTALCPTRRLYPLRIDGAAVDETTPLALDDGPPWQLSFELSRSERSASAEVVGWFRRDDRQIRLDDIDGFLGDRYFVRREAIAAFDWPRDDQRALARAWVDQLRAGPIVVPAADVPVLVARLQEHPTALIDVSPEIVPPIEDADPPTPRLALTEVTVSRGTGRVQAIGRLGFDYDGQVVAAENPATTMLSPDGSSRLRRHGPRERQARERLMTIARVERGDTFRLDAAGERWVAFLEELLDDGWYLTVGARTPQRPRQTTTRVRTDIDWFEVHGGVAFDAEDVAWPELLQSLSAGQRWIRLGDGSIGILPSEWVNRHLALTTFGQVRGDHLSFPDVQGALLDAILAGLERPTVDEDFETMRRRLARRKRRGLPAPPRGFRGDLRDYQREGLGWMKLLRDLGRGGCLADDMGLGKTVQVLAMLQARRLERRSKRLPSLIVVPRSLLGNWLAEAERFTPRLRIVDHTGPDRASRRSEIAGCDVAITTYGTLRRDVAYWNSTPLDYAILDEAQAIKNAASQTAKVARALVADHRLALSGTPIENSLDDLFSLFDFLNPGLLGAAVGIKRRKAALRQAGATVDDGERQVVETLARAVRPFVLRRTKRHVAPELPERIEQRLDCELTAEQRRWYEQLRSHYAKSVKESLQKKPAGQARMHVLEALLRLRQAACHPALVDPARAHARSAKFEQLVPRLRELVSAGHKALVFSQFTSLLALLRERLTEEQLDHAYLDGRTRSRQRIVDAFQSDPDLPLFLISLKAGGVGLNLTAADYVFLLDPWWNPAVEAQAIDRTHRIGQQRRVVSYRLVAVDTIEEKILELQGRKTALAEGVIAADERSLARLSADELVALFAT